MGEDLPVQPARVQTRSRSGSRFHSEMSQREHARSVGVNTDSRSLLQSEVLETGRDLLRGSQDLPAIEELRGQPGAPEIDRSSPPSDSNRLTCR